MVDITKTVTKGLELADDSFESKGELRELAMKAHTADMQSDNQLSKAVRPIIALVLLGLEVIVVISSLFGIEIPEHVTYELGAMLGAAIAFYMGSKGMENIADKKAKAEIKTKYILAEAAIEKERVMLREEVKDNKEERKAERKKNRKPLFGKRD